ncbi:MAG: hypothetical protein WCH46_07435 [bacterium]
MKLRGFSLSLCAILIVSAALLSSCTQTDTPGTGTAFTDTYADVSGLTVGQTYKFNITGGAAGTKIAGVSAYATGTVRVFWTRASGDSSQITVVTNSTASDAISWAAVTGSATIRLYESADLDPTHASGLVLSGASGPHSASISGAEKANIDLVLHTEPAIALPQLSLVSAKDGIASGNTRNSAFGFTSPTAYFRGGLSAQIFGAGDLSTIVNASNNFADITATHSDSASLVLVVKTQDNNYARIEVVAQAAKTTFGGVSGHFLWGDTGGATSFRYIDVKVTYNPTVNSPYAAIPSKKKDMRLAYSGN